MLTNVLVSEQLILYTIDTIFLALQLSFYCINNSYFISYVIIYAKTFILTIQMAMNQLCKHSGYM